MGDSFSIDVDFNGKEYSFEARLEQAGYTYKFYIVINGIDIVFEPDEERNYRAIINLSDESSIKDEHIELIKLIAAKIQSIL